MRTVELYTGAWYGDRRLSLAFPPGWDVRVMGESPGPPLGPSELQARLLAPIAGPRLSELARGRSSAVIVIDDISRPTPTAELIPLVLAELAAGGVPASRVKIVIAAGGHEPASESDNLKKVGAEATSTIGYEVHDPEGDLVHAGVSPSGIPLYLNRTVMAADLRVGIGGIWPHEGAGFSGGSKILVPGVAGSRTARYLHDFLRGARRRGDGVENEFRRELDTITGMLGLDFIVNVVLDHGRRIVDLFAGDRILAHRAGVQAASRLFAAPPVPRDAQVVVANTYPFDTNLYFTSWGLWPILSAPPGATKVVIADGSQGPGSHRLKPTQLSLAGRAWVRLRTLRPRHAWKQARHLAAGFRRNRSRRTLEFLVLCPNLSADGVAARFPAATPFRSWDELLDRLTALHGEGPVRVVVYPCAPFQIPMEESGPV